jgi:hypothetical protein
MKNQALKFIGAKYCKLARVSQFLAEGKQRQGS